MGEFTFEKIPFIDLIISGNPEKTTVILQPRKKKKKKVRAGLENAGILQQQLLRNPEWCKLLA